MLEKLFVYGTLRRGQANEFALKLAQESIFVNFARIKGLIYRQDFYPVLIQSFENEWVIGQLLILKNPKQTFDWLDQYEDVDHQNPNNSLYQREIIQVFFENGQSELAWTYVFCKSVAGLNLIKSGDFLNP